MAVLSRFVVGDVSGYDVAGHFNQVARSLCDVLQDMLLPNV